ncbi:MAG: SCO family protein [candidate division KSB1 bacterium]|nr:SCO family protein [candidate division KSB1 bacterium]MDZ7301548.1 SCO family protein [candidate division KSB1 bacterium]MDZ7311036.1 SCO family protein [candidate division KSB1 bacterium]
MHSFTTSDQQTAIKTKRSFIIISTAAALISTWNCTSGKQDPLPVLGSVPEFTLIERSGQPFGLNNLQDQIWIADFIFTNCGSICPIMTTAMTRVQQTLVREKLEQVKIVSITVDPERDTPEILSRYANNYGAEVGRWYFLTGARTAIEELATKGFMLGTETGGGPQDLIVHSDRFVLVDRQGRIRGYYHGTEKDEVAQLLKDLKKLYRETTTGGATS